MNYPNVVELAVPAFIALVVAEILLWRFAGRARFETRDTLASLTMGIGNLVIGALTGVFFYAIYRWVHQFALFEIGTAWWAYVLCFLAEDLAYYWFHRISHERRWFWASHVVHHSSQHYNLSTALRQTWTGRLSGAFLFWLPLPLIGFDPGMVIFFSGLSLIYQFWIHTEAITRLGPLEWVLNTPSHHRVHHARNPRYLDRNYAGVLIVWDRLFGTFEPETAAEPPRYGLVHNIATFNPLRIAFHEWISMFRDVLKARGIREAMACLFAPPGWRADGTGQTSAALRRRWRDGLAVSGHDGAAGERPGRERG